MAKYGKGIFMTRKMTITLEEELLTSLDNVALKSGKKKTQIIREALNTYVNTILKEEKIKTWEEENKKAIHSYNEIIEENGLILKSFKMF